MIFRIVRRIVNHPLNRQHKSRAIIRFLRWQIASRIINLSMIFNYAQKSKMILKRNLTVSTGNYYSGLFEFEEMSFVLHFLKKGDVFIDIGANIGSFTLLAANEIGVDTIAIEPIPYTFSELQENIRLNKIEKKVEALNIGLGAHAGVLKFTNTRGAINHVATDGETNTIDVPVKSYDEVVRTTAPALVKIDVEGFETEVLKGMARSLNESNIKAILIETNNAGERYGLKDDDIHSYLKESGFQPFLYDPFKRELFAFDPMVSNKSNNTVYLKDVLACQERLKAAQIFQINDVKF